MMSRPDWSTTWMTVAEVISRRSRCVRAQVGAVVVSSRNRLESTGYNGPSAQYPHEGLCVDFCPRAQGTAGTTPDYDACPSIHAETNALLYVDRSRVEGGTIFVNSSTCMNCAKLISNSGLAHLVHQVHPEHAYRKPEAVEEYLIKCGITVSRAPIIIWDARYEAGWRDAAAEISNAILNEPAAVNQLPFSDIADRIGQEADLHAS
jgi:dCMP deaminase